MLSMHWVRNGSVDPFRSNQDAPSSMMGSTGSFDFHLQRCELAILKFGSDESVKCQNLVMALFLCLFHLQLWYH